MSNCWCHGCLIRVLVKVHVTPIHGETTYHVAFSSEEDQSSWQSEYVAIQTDIDALIELSGEEKERQFEAYLNRMHSFCKRWGLVRVPEDVRRAIHVVEDHFGLAHTIFPPFPSLEDLLENL